MAPVLGATDGTTSSPGVGILVAALLAGLVIVGMFLLLVTVRNRQHGPGTFTVVADLVRLEVLALRERKLPDDDRRRPEAELDRRFAAGRRDLKASLSGGLGARALAELAAYDEQGARTTEVERAAALAKAQAAKARAEKRRSRAAEQAEVFAAEAATRVRQEQQPAAAAHQARAVAATEIRPRRLQVVARAHDDDTGSPPPEPSLPAGSAETTEAPQPRQVAAPDVAAPARGSGSMGWKVAAARLLAALLVPAVVALRTVVQARWWTDAGPLGWSMLALAGLLTVLGLGWLWAATGEPHALLPRTWRALAAAEQRHQAQVAAAVPPLAEQQSGGASMDEPRAQSLAVVTLVPLLACLVPAAVLILLV
jgi:hypothetical protein